jgi:hypothetical protein
VSYQGAIGTLPCGRGVPGELDLPPDVQWEARRSGMPGKFHPTVFASLHLPPEVWARISKRPLHPLVCTSPHPTTLPLVTRGKTRSLPIRNASSVCPPLCSLPLRKKPPTRRGAGNTMSKMLEEQIIVQFWQLVKQTPASPLP